MNKYAQSLPASAGQTYTVYPKQVISQFKSSRDAEGAPVLPSVIAAKHIRLTLIVDRAGNITTKNDYGYDTEIYDIR